MGMHGVEYFFGIAGMTRQGQMPDENPAAAGVRLR